MWYIKENPALANVADAGVDAVRAQETFRLTQVSRNLTAFQVLFLDIARPKELNLQKVRRRKRGKKERGEGGDGREEKEGRRRQK